MKDVMAHGGTWWLIMGCGTVVAHGGMGLIIVGCVG